jgi:hypothetical protein
VTWLVFAVFAVAITATTIALAGLSMTIRDAERSRITGGGLHFMGVTTSNSACPCSTCAAARAAPPATAAHPPNKVPTSGCACPLCTKARTGVGGSNTVHFNGGSGGSYVIGSGGAGGGGGSGGSYVIGSGGAGGGGGSNDPARRFGSGQKGIPGPIVPRPAGLPGSTGMHGFTEQGSGEFDLAVGTVRGLRQWDLQPPDLNSDPARANWTPPPMKGATGAFLWKAGVNEASCNKDRSHKPPVDVDSRGHPCACGFWAYWDIRALATGGAMSVNPKTGLPITGLIEGTGRTLVGERGFRCQRARIIALAPAFSVQAYTRPDYGDTYQRHMPRSRVVTDQPTFRPLSEYARQQEDLERERETYEAQQRADAWMATIQDRLGLMYPGARVFATLKGMLACVTTGEVT